MPAQVTNYQCPACGGPLRFDGATGNVVCDYCDSSFTTAYIEEFYVKKDEQAAENVQQSGTRPEQDWNYPDDENWGADTANMRIYNCPSCGAELFCESTTGATACPYCGNPTIVPAAFQGVLKPELIIPFKVDKAAAEAALKDFYKGKKLLPRTFTANNHIQEIKGVYVPFWLFDGEAYADVTFDATRVRSYTRGDTRYTETEHYDVHRAGTVSFRRIPVDASSKMPDAHMDSIEPFDYSELKPFSTAYLPGFLADKYDVDEDAASPRADARAEATAADMMARSVNGYTSCTVKRQETELRRGKAHYALFPVWMLHTRWNEQDFLFAMNGQTGKLVGDLPSDKKLWWSYFLRVFAGVAIGLPILLALLSRL